MANAQTSTQRPPHLRQAVSDAIAAELRTPPHSIEAEQSLLGALLIDNTAWDKIVDAVSDADFYRDDHRRIFQHVARLIDKGQPADVVTVFDSIQASPDRDRAGDVAYLASLAQAVPSAIHCRKYAAIIRERAVQRHLAQVASDIAEEALKPLGKDIAQLLDEAESRIFQIAEQRSRASQDFLDMKQVIARVLERVDYLYSQEHKSDVTGVPTGFIDLDKMTAGFQPGDLIVIAGRPSMGKTALALNIAENVAMKQGLPVALFSMEMSGTQLATRILGSIAEVDQHLMRTGNLTDQQWSALSDAMAKLHDAPIYIDETGALNILDIRGRTRRLKRQYGKLGLVVIDYLQLMSPTMQGENRATEISEISRGLKALAKEIEAPVVALSQLNRAVDQRPDRRPVMSDLRESGAIEQDADVILFIYREEIYKRDLPPEQRGLAEVIVGKQRNGPIGTVKMTFRGKHTRFDNYLDPSQF
jgi:replicative DNA helicase